MMRKICEKVGDMYAKRGRRRTISSEDYMIRHYLLRDGRKRDAEGKKSTKPNAFLHEIRGSDEPVYHDHPWNYKTIILAGGYWEHTPIFDHMGYIIGDDKIYYGPGSVLKRSANHFHYLEMGDKGSTWTLFLHGPRSQEWGFLPQTRNRQNKINHEEWTRYRHSLGFTR